MLGYLKNQKGSTLAVALIILVVFTVLGFGLITLNASATKQFTSKEQQVQARHFAEMGLMHYKSSVELIVEKLNRDIETINNNVAYTEDTKVEEINKLTSVSYLCDIIGDPLEKSVNSTNDNYDIKVLNCAPGTVNGLVDIIIESEGNSDSKVEEIELDFTIKTPALERERETEGGNNSENGNLPPAIPTPPSNDINNIWNPCDKKDCLTIETKYTDVSHINKVYSKKGNMTFKDNLIMNNFRVEGGNGIDILVEKDLYLKGELDVQTHACIMVQGNFTATTNIISKNKFYLFVYGDANLPAGFNIGNLTSSNNGIFVTGNVFIGGVKIPENEKKNLYKNVPNSHSDCSSLPGAPTPDNTPIQGDLNAVLIINEYRY